MCFLIIKKFEKVIVLHFIMQNILQPGKSYFLPWNMYFSVMQLLLSKFDKRCHLQKHRMITNSKGCLTEWHQIGTSVCFCTETLYLFSVALDSDYSTQKTNSHIQNMQKPKKGLCKHIITNDSLNVQKFQNFFSY